MITVILQKEVCSMQSVRKIDIHAHATLYPELAPVLKHRDPMISNKELLGLYDRLNIEKGVLQPLQSSEGMWTYTSSEAMKLAADQDPDRFLWFCCVDPRAGDNSPNTDLTILLNHYKSLGAKGVGELTAHLYADDPKMDNLFRCCAECDMPVTIHIAPEYGCSYGIVDELGLPRLEKMLKKHPKLKIFGHSQPFWAEMSADITAATRNAYPTGKVTEGRVAKLLRDYENLYCDFSAGSGANALMRDPEYAARFVEEFSDRILYGCDITDASTTEPFVFDAFLDRMVADGMISMENYVKFVRGNAIRLLNL